MSTAFFIATSSRVTFCSIKKANRILPTSDWRGWSRQRAPLRARRKFWGRQVTWPRNKRLVKLENSRAPQMSMGLVQCFTNFSLASRLLLEEQRTRPSNYCLRQSHGNRAC